MESPFEVDMSWVNLVAGEERSAKRAMPASDAGEYPQQKRSKIEGGELDVFGEVRRCVESMLDQLEGGEPGHEMRIDDAEMEQGDLAEEEKTSDRKEEYVAAGGPEAVEGERVEKEAEGVQALIRQDRDERTAFWTTSGLRPLAEPPVLDWDWFFRVKIPSDLRFKALFPDDPGSRAMMKDLRGEREVLIDYSYCAAAMKDDAETDDARREFHKNLCEDIAEEHDEVQREYNEMWDMANDLSRFEFMRLDNDGQTTLLEHLLEQWISEGADIFHGWDDAVRQKYRHLVPPSFVENPLATFQFRHLTRNGSTRSIGSEMKAGKDVLLGWPQEVQDKYGHLRQYLPRPPTPPKSPPACLVAGRMSKAYTTNARRLL